MPATAKPAAPPDTATPGTAQAAGLPAPLVAGYAAVGYACFLAVTGYAIGFFANAVVPTGIDHRPRSSWPAAVVIDLLLLSLFAVQHTVMARSWFKRAVYAAGWLLVLAATFAVSHADLFGLRQAYLHLRGARYTAPPFTERGLYRRVRHPLMTGFVVVFWAAPVMTAGHLLFAAVATGYILIGITFEERDLRRHLGAAYTAYAARVPALVPGLRRRGRALKPSTQPDETG